MERGTFARISMIAKTVSQRVTESNARKEAKGLKQVRSLWAYPDDIPAIREFTEKLTAQRDKLAKRARKEPKT